ncbi:hypothetical protein D931_01191 [Enterococcus faecium 13.SD.W.09]|nr:hypothetical protein D931_01191 [Enterococcus faecium 13.SD.W.09]
MLRNGQRQRLLFPNTKNQRFCGQSASETLIFFYYIKSWFSFLWE